MAISWNDISRAFESYLRRHPERRHAVAPLRQALETGDDLTSRERFDGHVTCSGAVISPAETVLHVHHRALDRWLLPGGHVEAEDVSLAGAAVREVCEETGLDLDFRAVSEAELVDIDIHRILANPAKGEPEHWHYDFTFVFAAQADVGELQAEEVLGAAWLPIAEAAANRPALGQLQLAAPTP